MSYSLSYSSSSPSSTRPCNPKQHDIPNLKVERFVCKVSLLVELLLRMPDLVAWASLAVLRLRRPAFAYIVSCTRPLPISSSVRSRVRPSICLAAVRVFSSFVGDLLLSACVYSGTVSKQPCFAYRLRSSLSNLIVMRTAPGHASILCYRPGYRY